MKGILFKPWKIKFIADHPDMEIQTRRVDGLKEINNEPDKWHAYKRPDGDWCFVDGVLINGKIPDVMLQLPGKKPRYRVGEVVYIKEAWAVGNQWDNNKPIDIDPLTAVWYPLNADLMNIPMWVGKMRSPMFLTECFARYFIKITDVKPQRLQEITWGNAHAEGAQIWFDNHPRKAFDITLDESIFIPYFQLLWNEVNPKYPWESNPWVWAYTVRKVDKP